MQIPKRDSDKLDDLKENVQAWHDYFNQNIERYNEFMRFVFKSGLTQGQINTLQELGKPTIEFNILESYISRQRGEFAKHQPSLTVRAADGAPINLVMQKEFIETIDVIEKHLRAIFSDSLNDNLAYKVFSDLLGGGFSVMQVYTDYISELSFEQNIYVDRVFDPTLTGFDPLARDSHKGDGRYCFTLYPMTKGQFEKEFDKSFLENMKFAKDISGFGWSYKNEKEDIILVCDYYEKDIKTEEIVKLTNGYVVTKKEYEDFLMRWNDDPSNMEVPPQVMDSRKTEIEKIRRYRFCETGMLERSKLTNYKHLPLIFFDGNSVILNEGETSQQMTRPAVYHAKGIQQLKTFAGQTLANELENMIQHKFSMAIESVNEDYEDALKNVQKADVIFYNHFLDENRPEVTLPPPQVINRQPIPQEVTNTFRVSDEMTQAILGSYDNAMGVNRAELSGVAIARGALQSNTAFMPYIVGYINGLNRIAQIIIDLIPKYYRTPRSLPVLLPNGKRDYELINRPGSLYMNYDPNSLQVKVETGVNFAMQKEMALQTITQLMQSSPAFAEFMNQYGLPILLDNVDIRGVEDLKEKAEEFQQQRMQMQEQQMQQSQQQMQLQEQKEHMLMQGMQRDLQTPSKNQIEMFKAQHQAATDDASTSIKEQDVENRFIETLAKVRNEQVENEIRQAATDAENARSAVQLAIQTDKHLTDKMKGDSDAN